MTKELHLSEKSHRPVKNHQKLEKKSNRFPREIQVDRVL